LPRALCQPVFPPGLYIHYNDDEERPYMLAESAAAARDYRHMPRDCALVTWAEGASLVVPGPSEMTDDECRGGSAWEGAGRALFEAHPKADTKPARGGRDATVPR
jgi:hypothetical protein